MEGAEEELRSRRSNLRLEGEREEIAEVLREGDEEFNEDHWEEEVEEIVDVREGDGRRRAVRRTKSELTLALAVHTIALCYYVYVLVWDSTVVKNHKGPASVWYGSTPYGGRWKFLTFINMRVQFGFFFLAFFTDIMPRSSAKAWFQKVVDFVFGTIVFPLTMVVFCYYWTLCFIDVELVHPASVEKYIPPLLDHVWHSYIMVAVLMEAILVFHQYPSNMAAFTSIFIMSTGYIMWVLTIFTKTGQWVYPFMALFNPLTFILFAAASTIVGFIFYHIGKTLCKINPYWRERFQALDARERAKYQ